MRVSGSRIAKRMAAPVVAVLLALGGCVTRSSYNTMLQQQQTLESLLRSEIAADQVKIEQLENGIRVRMSSDLLYESGAVAISAPGRAVLAKVTPQLISMAAEGYDIEVVGNTDDVPVGHELRDHYPTNWELAGARAAVVVRHLQESGVDPTKLQAVSDGHYHPVAPDGTPAGRTQNRRTDLVLRPH
jgi:chemotaxis protein MotB